MEETKKKLSGGKIAAIVIASILGVILIAVGVLAIVLFGAKQPEAVKVGYVDLDVSMMDPADPTGKTMKYYVGTDNSLALEVAFPGCTDFAGTYVGSEKGAQVIKRNARDFVLTYKTADGVEVTTNVYAVSGKNYSGGIAEKKMREDLADGKNVVLHEDITTKDKAGFEIAKDAHVYGNGHEMHADSISAPRGEKSWGTTLFSAKFDNVKKYRGGLHVQDLHIFVNTIEANENGEKVVDLDKFQYSGTGFDVATYGKDGKYAPSSLKNCIVENGQKLVHVTGGDVLIEGCIIRNGADANIAAGTYGGNPFGSTITIRNSVSMNSMVAGFLFYGWDGGAANNPDHQTTLNVEGFFDIYNWKSTNAAKLVPATEAPLDTIVNGQVLKSVNAEMFAPYVHFYDVNGDGKIQMPEAAAKNYEGKDEYKDVVIEANEDPAADERFIHIGIIRLATGSLEHQDPRIQFNGKGTDETRTTKQGTFTKAVVQPTYTEVDFPLPDWVTTQIKIVKRCDMVSYDNAQTPTISPVQQLDTKTIFKDMIFGREGFPVPTK